MLNYKIMDSRSFANETLKRYGSGNPRVKQYENRYSPFWYTVRKSYGVAENKWNEIQNLKKPEEIFRFDLEQSLIVLMFLFVY